MPIVIFYSAGEGAWNFVSSSQPTTQYFTQNIRYGRVLSIKKPFQGIKITKNE